MRVIDDCGGQFCKLERRYIIDYIRSVPVCVPLGYSTGKIRSSEHLSLAKSIFKVRVSDSEMVQKINQTKAAQIINMQHRKEILRASLYLTQPKSSNSNKTKLKDVD